MTRTRKILSVLCSVLVIGLGLPLGMYYLSVWNMPRLEELLTVIFADVDDPAFATSYLSACGTGSALAALAWALSFSRDGRKRPRLRLYLTIMVAGFMWAALLMGGFKWDEMLVDYPMVGAGLAITLLPGMLIWPLEIGMRQLTTNLGRASLKYRSPVMANFFLNIALHLPPYTDELEKAYALSLCESGKVREALPLLEGFWNLEGHPLETRMLAYLALNYKQADEVEKAIPAYEELYKRREGNRAIGQDLVGLYLKKNELQKALRVLEDIGDFADPKFIQYMVKLYIDTGRYDEAVVQAKVLRDKEGRPFEQTRRMLAQILKLAPKHEPSLDLKLELATAVEDKEEMIEALEHMARLRPADARITGELKTLYRDTFQFLQLEKFLRAQAALQIQDASVQHELIEALIQNQHYDDAQQMLEELVLRFPEDYRFWGALANILFRKNDFISARDALMNAFENCPEEKQSPLMFLKNKIFSALMNTELKRFQKAVEENPRDPQVRFQLVEQLLQNNFPERAATELDELIYTIPSIKPQVVEFVEGVVKRFPNSFTLMNYLADLLLRDKRYQDAFDMYLRMREKSMHPVQVMKEGCERILHLSPDFPPAIRKLGDLAHDAGDGEMTVQLYQRYLDLVPEPAEEDKRAIVKALFYSLVALGRLKESEKYGAHLLRLEPDDPEHYKTLGEIMESLKRLDEALDYFIKAERLAPDDYAIGKRRKEVENAQKKERIEKLKKVLDEREDNVPARLELGDLLFFFKDYNEALFHYQKAEKLPGGNNVGKAKVGYTLAMKGLDSIAEEHLEKVRLDREHLNGDEINQLKDVYFEIGKYYESIRDYTRALEYYKQIFNLDASYEDIVVRLERIEPKAARAKKYTRQ